MEEVKNIYFFLFDTHYFYSAFYSFVVVLLSFFSPIDHVGCYY